MIRLIPLILAFVISTVSAHAAWQSSGKLEKLVVSDTTVRQYIVSGDGQSLLVLDNKDILRKFDNTSGNLLWQKDLRSNDFMGYNFITSKLGVYADKYITIASTQDNFLIQVRLSGNDSVTQSQVIEKTIYNDMVITDNFFYLFDGNSDTSNQYDGAVFSATTRGSIRIFALSSDTLQFKMYIPHEYQVLTYFNRKSNKLLGYFIDMDIYEDRGDLKSNNFTQHIMVYDEKSDSVIYLYKHDGPALVNSYMGFRTIKNISLSDKGEFAALNFFNAMNVYDTRNNCLIKTIPYIDSLTAMAISNDDEYLLQASKNSIRFSQSRTLLAVDTARFDGLQGKITDLSYSPDGTKVYFKNDSNICRFGPELKSSPVRAFFYSDTNEIESGNSVSFTNCSGGYPYNFAWDFGDGTTSSEKNPVHVYTDTGYHDVRLTVFRGSEVDSYTANKIVHVLPFIKSDFDFVKNEDQCPVSVQFINKSLGIIDSLIWDFGDGSFSRDSSP